MSGTQTIDFAPLVDPVSADEITQYRRSSSRQGIQFSNDDNHVAGSVGQILLSALLIASALGFSAIIALTFSTQAPTPQRVALAIGLVVVLGGGVGWYGVWGLLRRVRFTSPWPTRTRMARFAAANGFGFTPTSSTPSLPSSVVVADRTSRTTDRFVLRDHPHVEIGNYSRVVGDWVNSQRHTWGYIAIELDESLPHIVLRSSRVLLTTPTGSLPATFTKEQAVLLDDEFGRHFDLFAPHGYEHEARRIVTSGFMSQLISEGNLLDVEISDRWLLLYSPHRFDFSWPETFSRALSFAALPWFPVQREAPRFGAVRQVDPEGPVPRLRTRRVFPWLAVAFIVVSVGVTVVRLTVMGT